MIAKCLLSIFFVLSILLLLFVTYCTIQFVVIGGEGGIYTSEKIRWWSTELFFLVLSIVLFGFLINWNLLKLIIGIIVILVVTVAVMLLSFR